MAQLRPDKCLWQTLNWGYASPSFVLGANQRGDFCKTTCLGEREGYDMRLCIHGLSGIGSASAVSGVNFYEKQIYRS